MNKNAILVIGISAISVILLASGLLYFSKKNNPSTVTKSPILSKETVQIPVNQENNNTLPTVEGNKSPKFVIDLIDNKYNQILSASENKLNELVEAEIISTAHANEKVEAYVKVDKNSKKLTVQPEDLTNFKPGLYKLSLKMRTLEGEVNLEQDFTWGVIAVNTNKSIYKPGENVKIGLGVLNNEGETLCMTGSNKVDEINMTIKNPAGQITNLSTTNNSIRDSGKCGPITVTNLADFQANYTAGEPGIYQMAIEASVYGEKRQITDYFKVDPNAEFDVERTDFPTRIYPKSIYPTALTITAKADYNGTVIDTVPAFFKIENISDGGKIIKDGNFQRIVWTTNLSAGKPKVFTYFINFPPISPEFYLLGPIKIGEFQEARQWQIASDAINSTSGLLTYEDNGGPNTFYQVWTGTAYNTRVSMDGTPADSRWFKEVSSPKTGEKLVAVLDNVGPDVLYVFRWSGTSWGSGPEVTVNSGTTSSMDISRMMDITYEELSGEALFVYSKGTGTTLYYQTRTPGSSGSWSGEQTAATISSFTRWVRMKPQFESDTILVGYLTDLERVGALIWDGSTNTFGDQLSDASGTQTATSDEQAFDVAIETSSGTPMIFWGTTGNNLVYREFTGGTWQAEATATSGFTNDLDWVFAASDPVSTSNNISISMQDGTSCVARMGIWTGSAISMNGTTPACASVSTNNLVDTAFENTGGRAMFVLIPNDGADDDNIEWWTWTSGGGFSGANTISQTTPNVIESISLFSDLNTKNMMLLFHDNATTCDLYYNVWNGDTSSWDTSALAYDNMCASADNDTVPYGFGFDRNLEKLVAYRWFNNVNGDTGAGLSALTSQDTTYTLTSANQQFRLRLLLNYPDSVPTSLGRQYKLQYVDPGSGSCSSPTGGTPSTWTDVPTSGGTTISFANSGSLNSGDNIATNSADPTFQGLTTQYQDFQKSNNFTNSRTNISADQNSIWDFSLIDNTTYDRIAQTYCFRVARSNDVVLRIGLYPQMSTAALPDVLIQGGSLIQGGTRINNPNP